MKILISDKYKEYKVELLSAVNRFNYLDDIVYRGDRNSIKKVTIDNKVFNIKSFKVPNLINSIVYKYIRKSKAERSFTFAHKLSKLDILTPIPVAYFELSKGLGFGKSFYISKQLDYDLTYRELCTNLNYPEHKEILRAFTKFTYDLHEKGVNFLDHSQGNTLIKKTANGFSFYLVDLNRMEFNSLDFESRMKNFSRLTKQDAIVKVMSDQYSKLYKADYNKVYFTMWKYINKFQKKRDFKKQIKKKLLFRI